MKHSITVRRGLRWALNGVALLSLAIVIWQITKPYLPFRQDAPGLLTRGQAVTIASYSWREAPKTVLLAVSVTCPYCTDSAAFYRALLANSNPDRYRVVVTAAEPEEQVEAYLKSLALSGTFDIRTVAFRELGVRVVPTVVVVDRNGLVQGIWHGKLSAPQEDEVWSALNLPGEKRSPVPATSAVPSDIAAAELRRILDRSHPIVLDIRERSRFREAHIARSLTMPLDEIVARAPHELPTDKEILIYCLEYSGTSCSESNGALSAFGCKVARKVLTYAGFNKIRIITDNLTVLSENGVPVEGTPCR